MQTKSFVSAALRHITLVVLVSGVASVFATALVAADSTTQVSRPGRSAWNEAPVEFYNRVIVTQRGTLAGATAQERAERASEHLDELPLNVKPSEVELRPVKIENQDGVVFMVRGRFLFFVGTGDLDKESGETIEQAAQAGQRNLVEALQARGADRSWPIIRAGILFTVIGLAAVLVFCTSLWKIQSRLLLFVHARQGSFPVGLRLFGFNLLPYLAAILRGLVRSLVWVLTLIAVYLWVTLSLRRFPYTEPWGREAGHYVLALLRELANTVLYAMPGLLAVFLIFLGTRWFVRLGNALFEQIATGRMSVSWMDADVARATQRIFAAIAWIFAVIVAYPYIPGSATDAFKGISVFIGLVVSLGSTGIINQIMSGLFVVYSRALKAGEWVKVDTTEGEVLEVGLLAAKVRTIEGQEVTIPNSVLVGTSTTNYTRLGMVLSATVTIGYDAPWRQVHALLLRAADRTPFVRKQPEPFVVQRALSDFYVEYTLIARLEDETHRVEALSSLNSQIQDAFNEFGVQIMSPHYMVPAETSVVIPPAKWHAPPAEPKP